MCSKMSARGRARTEVKADVLKSGRHGPSPRRGEATAGDMDNAEQLENSRPGANHEQVDRITGSTGNDRRREVGWS